MSYRSILVHVDASPRCAMRIDLAARLARTHGGHLLGLVTAAVVEPQPRMSAALAGTPDFLDTARAQVAGAAAALLEAFERSAAARGVESIEGRWVAMAAFEALVARGRHADLVVLGQCAPGAAFDAEERDLVQRVLLQVGCPVLVIPSSGTFDAIGSAVMIAWKDTREAARAVRDALPILRRAQQVHLVCLERPSDNRHVSRPQLDELRRWLSRHGVEVAVHQEAASSAMGKRLLARAGELGADLIVMGGYGHSRLQELVLGGVTRTLLAHMTMPVLLSHSTAGAPSRGIGPPAAPGRGRGGFAVCAGSAQLAARPVDDLRRRHGAGAPRDLAAAAKEQQRRNAADRVARAQRRRRFGVELGEADLGQLLRGARELRRHRLAGAAPLRPAIDQHRHLRALDVAVEGGFVERDRRRRQQPCATTSAQRVVLQARIRNAILAAAGRADKLHGCRPFDPSNPAGILGRRARWNLRWISKARAVAGKDCVDGRP